MLRYRAREYDTAVRYHAEMNFNMIRNWVGQIGEDEFYQACDRHGVVVWQDFWLANPWDGPDPDDDAMFLANARDFVLRIRNHPSIGLYVGRNEGYPPPTIDEGIRATLAAFHPDLHYISSSADDVVEGHGPYQAQPQRYYFSQRATPKLHSEMGMPNMVTLDSLRLMMPESAMWPPQGALWGMHDFTNGSAQNGGDFRARIEKNYGPADNVADWLWLAQFENYNGHRAMFEAQSKNRMGLLIWMSHRLLAVVRLADLRLLLRTHRRLLRRAQGFRAAAHPVERRHRRYRSGQLQRRRRCGPHRPRATGQFRWRREVGEVRRAG